MDFDRIRVVEKDVFYIALSGRALEQFSRFQDRNPFWSRKTRARVCTDYANMVSLVGNYDMLRGVIRLARKHNPVSNPASQGFYAEFSSLFDR